jgi:3-carboxy-cis,cis-muconate cycloisomerase
MPSHEDDSLIFRDIFSTNAVSRIFGDRARVQYYLDIEAALALVQARLGLIPQGAAAEIARHCQVDAFDFAALKRDTERIGYPVLPVVRQLVGLCRDGLGEWCHWGATTQDITDTATILQIRDGLKEIERDVRELGASLSDLARRYRDTPMAGRSNLQHAVPITFGYKMAVLLAGFTRHLDRLAELRPRVLVGEFGGAAGNLSSLGLRGLEVQAALCDQLGLGRPDIAWHTMRDRIAEVGCFLGLLTGTAAKISTDVKLLMQTEVEEVQEPFADGRGSSSTMPQKRNPISSNYIHACAALVRQHAAALLDAQVADHERSTGPWEIEWIAVPEIFRLSAAALAHARALVAGLQVDPGRMQRNLGLTRGLLMSEAVMMRLGPMLGRQRSHDLVYAICRRAIAADRPLVELLAEDPDIGGRLSRTELETLMDPGRYLGLCGEMVDRVLASSRLP